MSVLLHKVINNLLLTRRGARDGNVLRTFIHDVLNNDKFDLTDRSSGPDEVPSEHGFI